MLINLPAMSVYGQSERVKRASKVWVTFMNGSQDEGFLYEVNSEGISICTSDPDDGNCTPRFIKVENIRDIKLRKKRAGGKGAGIGFLAGAVVGSVIGATAGSDSEVGGGAGAAVVGISVGAIGAGVGALIGSSKKHFQINGDATYYEAVLSSLKAFTY